MTKIWSLLALPIVLVGCAASTPMAPYVEPPATSETARVRVIANTYVYGDVVSAGCKPPVLHRLVAPGKVTRNGKANDAYPPFPVSPKLIEGMPARAAPKLSDVPPLIRISEGNDAEVQAEYVVPANVPFQIKTYGATWGLVPGKTYYSCGEVSQVFKLKPGEDYEVVVGVTPMQKSSELPLACIYRVSKLVSLPGIKVSYSIPLTGEPAPTKDCGDQK